MTWSKQKLRGMSLVEMLVAIGIMLIVTAGTSSLLITIWKSQGYQIRLGQAAQFASRGVSLVVKNIRQAQQADDGAFLVKSGDNFDFVFFANIDSDTAVERIHYYLTGDTFMMGVADPSVTAPYTYPVDDTMTQIISSNVVNTATDLVFQYYDRNANLLPLPIDPSAVRMVEVQLLVDVDPFSSPIPITVKSRTTIRNLVNY